MLKMAQYALAKRGEEGKRIGEFAAQSNFFPPAAAGKL
jgi:hypothetical protein